MVSDYTDKIPNGRKDVIDKMNHSITNLFQTLLNLNAEYCDS